MRMEGLLAEKNFYPLMNIILSRSLFITTYSLNHIRPKLTYGYD